ncbi:hypothetical protein DYY67_1439 [Candidatus Nitrosotalea sp. TS]|uniref:hypothetical protein n=1 Tax=Candidatus Nitrosotalea sp. TS TaxID=2341020 RepID=UPI0014094F4C|nr:hypothetical protein [Candidatus Nitrosotalea sp. TS]NHI04064.1 hypothetical protein [Candidatus Nitrosotalea sp. TS]
MLGTSGSKATSGGDVIAPVMTNLSCFAEAIATFHLRLNGFTGYETCNPYSGTQTESDKIPFYVTTQVTRACINKDASLN